MIPKQILKHINELNDELKGPDARYYKITNKNFRNYEKIEERFFKYQ